VREIAELLRERGVHPKLERLRAERARVALDLCSRRSASSWAARRSARPGQACALRRAGPPAWRALEGARWRCSRRTRRAWAAQREGELRKGPAPSARWKSALQQQPRQAVAGRRCASCQGRRHARGVRQARRCVQAAVAELSAQLAD
jgi:hypothetical protein